MGRAKLRAQVTFKYLAPLRRTQQEECPELPRILSLQFLVLLFFEDVPDRRRRRGGYGQQISESSREVHRFESARLAWSRLLFHQSVAYEGVIRTHYRAGFPFPHPPPPPPRRKRHPLELEIVSEDRRPGAATTLALQGQRTLWRLERARHSLRRASPVFLPPPTAQKAKSAGLKELGVAKGHRLSSFPCCG